MNWLYCFKEYERKYRSHAIERMFQRDISFEDIDQIYNNVEVIEEYPDDFPFPSCLVLGFNKSNKPIHMVFSVNQVEKTIIIITVYEPDKDIWEVSFKRRKS